MSCPLDLKGRKTRLSNQMINDGVSQSGAGGSRATQTGSPKGEAGGSDRIKHPTKSEWLFFRSQQRKQDHVADGFRAGKQHGEPVHSETKAAGRRHAVLERQ